MNLYVFLPQQCITLFASHNFGVWFDMFQQYRNTIHSEFTFSKFGNMSSQSGVRISL